MASSALGLLPDQLAFSCPLLMGGKAEVKTMAIIHPSHTWSQEGCQDWAQNWVPTGWAWGEGQVVPETGMAGGRGGGGTSLLPGRALKVSSCPQVLPQTQEKEKSLMCSKVMEPMGIRYKGSWPGQGGLGGRWAGH